VCTAELAHTARFWVPPATVTRVVPSWLLCFHPVMLVRRNTFHGLGCLYIQRIFDFVHWCVCVRACLFVRTRSSRRWVLYVHVPKDYTSYGYISLPTPPFALPPLSLLLLHKRLGISWVAKWLVLSQGGLCSVDLVMVSWLLCAPETSTNAHEGISRIRSSFVWCSIVGLHSGPPQA
jgi:hypothetical protein